MLVFVTNDDRCKARYINLSHVVWIETVEKTCRFHMVGGQSVDVPDTLMYGISVVIQEDNLHRGARP